MIVETVTAVYKNGILKPKKPLNLGEDEQVEIQIDRKTGQIVKEHQRRSAFEAKTVGQINIGVDIFEYLHQKKFMFVDMNHLRTAFLLLS